MLDKLCTASPAGRRAHVSSAPSRATRPSHQVGKGTGSSQVERSQGPEKPRTRLHFSNALTGVGLHACRGRSYKTCPWVPTTGSGGGEARSSPACGRGAWRREAGPLVPPGFPSCCQRISTETVQQTTETYCLPPLEVNSPKTQGCAPRKGPGGESMSSAVPAAASACAPRPPSLPRVT